MTTVQDIATFLEIICPTHLAADWDNVGLLAGDTGRRVERVMTCLTITAATAAEAIAERADLIVTHHPLPFKAVKRITTSTHEGRLLWELISAGISIYSPHTSFDSASDGINQRLAVGIGLEEIDPLISSEHANPDEGTGRCGIALGQTLRSVAAAAKQFLRIEVIQVVGEPDRAVARIAVACGSAGEFARPAYEAGCDCLVTGEARFHTCLEAESLGIALVLTGHYASERFALEHLARVLSSNFADVQVWASSCERDPLRWL